MSREIPLAHSAGVMTCPDSQKALADLVVRLVEAAQATGSPIQPQQIHAELLTAPHQAPRALPAGKQAVYWFCLGGRALKVGRSGPNSGARYTSQHYNPGVLKVILRDRSAGALNLLSPYSHPKSASLSALLPTTALVPGSNVTPRALTSWLTPNSAIVPWHFWNL
jgi:hypothetical protein